LHLKTIQEPAERTYDDEPYVDCVLTYSVTLTLIEMPGGYYGNNRLAKNFIKFLCLKYLKLKKQSDGTLLVDDLDSIIDSLPALNTLDFQSNKT
jgi:hypothetical protein